MERRKALALSASIVVCILAAASAIAAVLTLSQSTDTGLGPLGARPTAEARPTAAPTTVAPAPATDDAAVPGEPAGSSTGGVTFRGGAAVAAGGDPIGPSADPTVADSAGGDPAAGDPNPGFPTTRSPSATTGPSTTIRPTTTVAPTSTPTTPVTTTTAPGLPTTTRPSGVPADWPANKPIPPKPANCVDGQLEDNGVWNCQH